MANRHDAGRIMMWAIVVGAMAILLMPSSGSAASGPSVSIDFGANGPQQTAVVIQILILLTVLSLAPALFKLGGIHFKGEGVPRDVPRSVALFRDAVSAKRVAKSLMDRLVGLASRNGVRLEAGELPEARILGDRQYLAQMITNLIDNAIKYGHRGGRITLRLTRAPATLVVDDDGPGIPQAERERVLERFYRRPDSGGSGCGLGLAIANEIAARHKATLRILDNPGGRGTRIEVAFSGGDARSGKEVGPAA